MIDNRKLTHLGMIFENAHLERLKIGKKYSMKSM